MIYLAATALAIVNIFWLLATLLMLPGNWLMLATGCLAAWWREGSQTNDARRFWFGATSPSEVVLGK